MSSSPEPPPLVWITVGSTQHAAYLLESQTERCLVQWATRQDTEWVKAGAIQRNLLRRRQRPTVAPPKTPMDKQKSGSSRRKRKLSVVKAVSTVCELDAEPHLSPDLVVKDAKVVRTGPVRNADQMARDVETVKVDPTAPLLLSTASECDSGLAASNTDNNTKLAALDEAIPTDLCALGDAETLAVDLTTVETSAAPEASLTIDVAQLDAIAPATEPPNEPDYSPLTSAYLQNLAEIAALTLGDRRWTCGSDAKPLFQWEHGEDLSILRWLSRRYIPPAPVQPVRCTCLLCRDKKDVTDSLDESTAASTPTSELDEEDDDRCLHLYCRLFYRKGPWFRLDDVYTRYYAPKEKAIREEEDTSTVVAKENSPPRKHHFFSLGSICRRKPSPATPAMVDERLIEKHLSCVKQLFADVRRLAEKGAIRSFDDEAECGKTVGVSLLAADERQSVLSLIGGGKSRGRTGREAAVNGENAIWKQMTSQRSVFGSHHGGKGTSQSVFLPVRQHVNNLLLDKLVRNIVMASSYAQYLPASVMKAQVDKVRTKLVSVAQDLQLLCFRLREEPTLVLQRCVRLQLCACGGPGDMRGDGLNGWRSLRDAQASNTPLAKVLPPPSVSSFHQVSFAGLSHRFGLSSACSMHSFVPRPVGHQLNRSDCGMDQVFFDRLSFLTWELCVELRANVDYLLELNETLRYNERRQKRGVEPLGGKDPPQTGSVDFMRLLAPDGRKTLLNMLMPSKRNVSHLFGLVEKYVSQCFASLESECEQILAVVASLVVTVLGHRNRTIPQSEYTLMAKRPWLRHLWWDAVLGYLLWDIVPILERSGLHRLAVDSLELLLFGRVHLRERIDASTLVPINTSTTQLAPLLLSRRARGKAFDRLVIDYNHMLREGRKPGDTNGDKKEQAALRTTIVRFCDAAIESAVGTSYIAFSSVRGLARRLKQPLAVTLERKFCLEATELGLRLKNDAEMPTANEKASKKYSDWTPVTDKAIANAVANTENGVGFRCSFVGFEDDGGAISSGSVNVEQLAMEYYNSGRLPEGEEGSSIKGGWVGWHDEGGHVRALFRILSSAPVLGADWGCSSLPTATREAATLHLSPYQGIPFDLHVGFDVHLQSQASSDGHLGSAGFYFRRRAVIDAFVEKLGALSEQEVSDLVHESVASRLRFMVAQGRKDPFLDRDLQQLRTLSLIAAGCGGKQLAAVCRSLFFDYRHFSGGLPDLLMVRACYHDNNPGLVDLGSWVGEAFALEKCQQQEAQRAAAMLADRDDEFLGCSKVGDSSGRAPRFGSSSSASSKATTSKLPTMDALPPRLELCHEHRPVKVECMMVEVKSSNDRLDPRQEDWLNILDRNGNARVCKFEASRKRKAPPPAKSSSSS